MKKSERLFLVVMLYISLSITFLSSASAYIDPSTSTLIIQAVVGAVVAAGAVVAVWWRRAKKKVADKLGIDENARKTSEGDVQENEEDDD